MVKTMKRSYSGVFMLMAAMALLCMLAGSSGAAGGDTTRVNLDSTGTQTEGGGSGTPSISANGRYVTFISSATNLVEDDLTTTNVVEDDTNGVQDVFVHDRQEGITERVSVDSSEAEANGQSLTNPSISADGRYVAFHSAASNLVPDDTNGKWDVFVRDVQEGTTERVSVDSSEAEANGHNSSGSWPTISADGRYVAFSSYATNLVAGGKPGGGDIYVRDRTEGKTERANLVNGSLSSVSNGYDFHPSISGDGRYVAWISSASNLVAGDTNTGVAPGYDVFVRDRQTSTTKRVSVDSFDRQASLGAACQFFCSPNHVSDVSISSDGRYVAWHTFASDLVPAGTDTNGLDDVFVRDRDTDADGVLDEAGAASTERVSVAGCGIQANDGSWNPEISPDGRYVTFTSSATNLVADDTNGLSDVFLRDREMKTTQRVSVVHGSGTQANGSNGSGSDISAGGTYATFSSSATNLVADDTNGFSDIFVHERGSATQSPTDCTAPTTTRALLPQPNAAGWNNSNVTVTLSAQDNEGGSGVKEIRYSATGAQSIPETVYDPQNPPIINTEGTTTITYFATDNAGNRESPAKTLTVKIDKGAPTVGSVSPANAAVGVSLTANAEATFSEAMDPNTLSAGTFTLTKQNSSTPVAATVSYGSTTNKATLNPSSNLSSNTTYRATIKGGSTGARDSAGNALVQDYSWSFTTAADTAAPRVSTATPTGTGVSRGTNAIATFSERMDPTSITTSTFKLFRCSSTTSTNCATQVTNVAIARSTDRLKATLNPFGTSSTLLAGRTKFKVVVTTGAKDEAGNQLDQNPSTAGNQNKVWYFTTGSS